MSDEEAILDETMDNLREAPLGMSPTTVRFFHIRGLTIPLIFLLSIGVSFFSVSVAIFSWLVLIVVDA